MVVTHTSHLDVSPPLRLVIRPSWRHDEAAALDASTMSNSLFQRLLRLGPRHHHRRYRDPR